MNILREEHLFNYRYYPIPQCIYYNHCKQSDLQYNLLIPMYENSKKVQGPYDKAFEELYPKNEDEHLQRAAIWRQKFNMTRRFTYQNHWLFGWSSGGCATNETRGSFQAKLLHVRPVGFDKLPCRRQTRHKWLSLHRPLIGFVFCTKTTASSERRHTCKQNILQDMVRCSY